MKYFIFHIGDWLTSTRTLTATERGVYLDLLCLYYGACKCICKDDAKRLALAYAPSERRALQYVLAEFFTEKDGCFYNARCEREIREKKQLSQVRQRAATARWKKENGNSDPEKTDANAYAKAHANAMQGSTAIGMPSINQYPLTIKREREERAPAKPTRTADANKPTPTPKRLTPPEGIPEQAWSDWMQVRGNAPVTKSFWRDFCNNADKLHLTPAKAVELCAQRGWKRLDADWESVKVAESNEDRLLRLMGEA